MKNKLTWKIWLLIVFIIFSLLSILGFPPIFLQKGILITSIDSDSPSFEQGLREGQIIIGIDGKEILNLEDYSIAMSGKFNSNENVKTIMQTKETQIILFSNSAPKITISELPKTNIRTGLDISGGARALVEAEEFELSPSDTDDLTDIIRNRLNVYGLEDIAVSSISDFSGNNYVKIEIAGATPNDLKDLISEQGKFEAKIGNETVFIGGEKDVTSVARSGQEAVIDLCQQSSSQEYFCSFRFSIYLSEDAAKRHSEITESLDFDETGNYLSERLDLFLDDKLVDSLLIGESLKGRVTTQISISGSGSGQTESEAYENAVDEMTQLQTVLITGSLPYKLKISKLDIISPSLGEEFVTSILLAGFVALFAVSVIIFFRYKNFKSSLALLLTSVSEVIIILGIASLIKWNLDLPSIAGILATIGTGIDQQIIILDEAKSRFSNLDQRLKRAFKIILGAYFTAVVALIPLYWAAAGFFKGFAITTIIGITAGVLITRPAFSDMVGKIEGESNQ